MLSSKTFDYNAAKKDQLAVYNGSMLTYDANGCLKTAPGTVMNTSGTVTYGWTGGRLTSASWGSTPLNACTYAYDGYGRRISKTHTVTVLGGSIPSQTIKSTGYTYDQSGRLICERISTSSTAGSISTEEKLYLYDEANVVGMIYTANGTTNTYYFDKDVFGNVLGIHNAQGIQQCRYVYDAFGNCKVLNPDGTVNISSTFIGNINPFRYKGYYYDKETCLYYLGTRYYCPDLCRFIQPADVSSLIPSTVNGLNLYAFANNNPTSDTKFIGGLPYRSANGAFVPNYQQMVSNWSAKGINYFNPHAKEKWFDTDWPSFFILSDDGFEIVNWGLSVYKRSFYFDNNENHSLYVSFGNIGVYAGLSYRDGIGIDVGASLLEFGYDGRIIDVGMEGLGIGMTYMFKDGVFKFKVNAVVLGFSMSIDFVELFKMLFGGK